MDPAKLEELKKSVAESHPQLAELLGNAEGMSAFIAVNVVKGVMSGRPLPCYECKAPLVGKVTLIFPMPNMPAPVCENCAPKKEEKKGPPRG